jgi:hypothetical protein
MLKELRELKFYERGPGGCRLLMSNMSVDDIAERLGEQKGNDGIPVVETDGPILGFDDDSEVDVVNGSITRRRGVLTGNGEEVPIAEWKEPL